MPSGGFFCIYLYPETFGEPVAVWGTVEPTHPDGNKGPIIKQLHMQLPNPTFVERLGHPQWVPAFAHDALWKKVSYRACPQVDLSSPDEVQKLVIQPLCKKLKELNGRQPQ